MNKKYFVMTVLAAICVVTGLTVKAADSGGYLGAGVGSTDMDISEGQFSLDDNDVGWKVIGGYKISPYLAVEGGWVSLGTFEDTVLGIPVELDLEGFAVSGLGIIPLNKSVSLFGRVGVWWWEGDFKISTFSADDDDTDMMFGVGANVDVTDSFSLRVEWERYTADSDDVDFFGVSGIFGF